jgi:hypothetical protein
VINFTPRPLYPQGKILWYTMDTMLGWGAKAVLDVAVKRKIPNPL